MSAIRICGIKRHSFVDGPGIRFTVFTQGCPHGCAQCQNPDTWNENGGILTDTSELIIQLSDEKYIDGVTLSGGDPFLQGRAISEIAEAAHRIGLSVWAYTGWTFEELFKGLAGDFAKAALKSIDVLVDGRFIKARSQDAPIWRGSSNQRLIDVKKSLDCSAAVLYEHRYDLKAAN